MILYTGQERVRMLIKYDEFIVRGLDSITHADVMYFISESTGMVYAMTVLILKLLEVSKAIKMFLIR